MTKVLFIVAALLVALAQPAMAQNTVPPVTCSTLALPASCNDLNRMIASINATLAPKGTIYYATNFLGQNSARTCIWDPSNDVMDCINAAVATANAQGGGRVIIPAGSYLATVPQVQSPANNVGITIEGAGGPGEYGPCQTKLTWAGSSAATMFSFIGATSLIAGGGLRGVCLDLANGLGANGIKMRGGKNQWFQDVFIKGPSASGVDMDALDVSNGSNVHNFFVSVNMDLSPSGSASANGYTIGQSATTTGNDSYDNHWIGGIIQYQNGVGFSCGAADSNEVLGMDIQNVNSGTGVSLDLKGHASNALLACRSNRFITSAGFGRSNGTAPVAETATHPSGFNYIWQSTESGGGLPVINGNATLIYETNTGTHYSNVGGAATYAFTQSLKQYSGSGGSAIPACGSGLIGSFATVTDGKASPTAGSAYAAGDGAASQPVWCNGASGSWLYLM